MSVLSASRGTRWARGVADYTAANTILPPNSASCITGGFKTAGQLTVTSRHGGAHVLMGDGAVRFISENIDTGNLAVTHVKAVTGPSPIELTCCDAGALVLPSGALVACDPQFDGNQQPFEPPVVPGEYPIFLAPAGEGFGVALTMVQFEEREPVRWERTRPSRYSVDSGTASLLDAKLARMLLRRVRAGRFEQYWKQLEGPLDENGGLWANVCLHQDSGANIFVCQTFGGDGAFPSFWGYSQNDELVRLMTDYFLEDVAIRELP